MKINKITNLLMVAVLFLFAACEPIEDRDELVNNATVNDVGLIATQSSPGGNQVTLHMNTPGVTGHWDYNLGKAFTDKVTFVYPIPGNNTFTFNGTLGKEFFSKTIDVQIDVLDTPLDQDWYDLVSNNTSAGKTWVFDKSRPHWYMVAPNNPDGWQGIWWDAGCCINGNQSNGKMTFDLNGAANYYHDNGDGGVTLGSFVLDVTNQKLAFSGANVLGDDGARAAADGVYDIISLTETELILHLGLTPAGDSGWVWVFKPE